MGQKSEIATLEAAQKMGELLLQIQKASGGVNQYNKEEKSAITEKSKTKAEVISEIGIERHAANDYQQMAQNPEAQGCNERATGIIVNIC